MIQWSSQQVWGSIGFTSGTKRFGAGSVATSAARLATASWLARSFATASWLSATCWLAAVVAVLVEQALKEALLLASGITSGWLATASRLAGCFATASRLARCFAATCWLYVTTRVATLVTQFVKQAERASVG